MHAVATIVQCSSAFNYTPMTGALQLAYIGKLPQGCFHATFGIVVVLHFEGQLYVCKVYSRVQHKTGAFHHHQQRNIVQVEHTRFIF